MAFAVMAAMQEELIPIRQQFLVQEIYRKGSVIIQEVADNTIPLLIVESGIGKVNAAVAAAIVFEKYSPQAVLHVGTAGAFADDLDVGDIVVGTEAVYSDVDATGFGYEFGQVPRMPVRYEADARLLNIAKMVAESKFPRQRTTFGQILTSDSFMSDLRKVELIKQRFPDAKVSDMEGAAVAQTALAFATPYINIRSVSDIAGKDAAKSFDSNISSVTYRVTDFLLYTIKAIHSD